VGDQHRGRAGLAQQALDVGPDGGAQAGVERPERLVEQDQAGLDGQRPGQCDPLLLATGELVRVAAAQAGQADRLQQVADGRAAALPPGQPEPDVGGHREVREQAALLRHVADAAALGRLIAAGTVHDGAAEGEQAAVGVLEAGDHPQQRGLATARRAQDGGQRVRRDLKVHVIQHRSA
jgi:hypothetical protein